MAAGQDDKGRPSKRRSSGVAIGPPPVVALIAGETRCLIASMARREVRSINDARGRGEHRHGLSFSSHEGERGNEREKGLNCRSGRWLFRFFRFYALALSEPRKKNRDAERNQFRVIENARSISGTRILKH